MIYRLLLQHQVLYIKLSLTNGEIIDIESPSDFPDPATELKTIYEPMINAQLLLPKEYLGNIIKLMPRKTWRTKRS